MKENFLQFMDDPETEERLETFCALEELETFCIPAWLLIMATGVLGLLLWFLLHLLATNACGI